MTTTTAIVERFDHHRILIWCRLHKYKLLARLWDTWHDKCNNTRQDTQIARSLIYKQVYIHQYQL